MVPRVVPSLTYDRHSSPSIGCRPEKLLSVVVSAPASVQDFALHLRQAPHGLFLRCALKRRRYMRCGYCLAPHPHGTWQFGIALPATETQQLQLDDAWQSGNASAGQVHVPIPPHRCTVLLPWAPRTIKGFRSANTPALTRAVHSAPTGLTQVFLRMAECQMIRDPRGGALSAVQAQCNYLGMWLY